MATIKEILGNKADKFTEICKMTNYSDFVIEETLHSICCCNDKDKALAYMTDLAKKKIEEQEFYTEVVGLVFDEEKLESRLKF